MERAPRSYWRGKLDSDERYTPPDILELVRTLIGPGWVDPCCSPNAPAWDWTRPSRRITKGIDCLSPRPWPDGPSLFVQPPYSNCEPFLERAHIETRSRNLALIKVDTSTNWFHAEMRRSRMLLLLNKRVKFMMSRTEQLSSAPFPSGFFYWGEQPEITARTFEASGWGKAVDLKV